MTDEHVITPEMKGHKEAQEKEKAQREAAQAAAELEAARDLGPRKGPSPKPEAQTPWPQQNIPIRDIEIGERLWPLDPAEVDRKAESIAQIGPLQAITVAKHPSKSKAATRLGPFTCSRQDYTAPKRARN